MFIIWSDKVTSKKYKFLLANTANNFTQTIILQETVQQKYNYSDYTTQNLNFPNASIITCKAHGNLDHVILEYPLNKQNIDMFLQILPLKKFNLEFILQTLNNITTQPIKLILLSTEQIRNEIQGN